METNMSDKFVLLALAPWPTLLSLVRPAPHDWIVWGNLPPAVHSRFEAIGVEVRNEALPKPFHRAELPRWLRASHHGIVVPALGHPLPTRWPIVRHAATAGTPVYTASHGRMMRAPEIPAMDAFTWALDRGSELAAPKAPAVSKFSCVRVDLLGDLLLALPALTALAAQGSIRLIIREEWKDWMRHLLPAGCEVQGLRLTPWAPPCFEPADISVDLSPPGWRSVLTPAISREIPAKTHVRLLHGKNLSEMIALALGLEVHWPGCKPVSGTYGVLVPSGSSLERILPDDYWTYAIRRMSQVMGIHDWTILDPENQLSPGLLRSVPHAQLLLGRKEPHSLIDLVRGAAVVVGVSTALTHLAALTGTPALVVEHPTTVSEMYRAPVPFVHYIRPAKPWWCDNPSEDDIDRAMDETESTYGFIRGEWRDAVEQAITQPPFSRP
jgi:hypothetical protein